MEKETTRQRILLEALKLFAKDGFEAVSVEQIANAVGIKAPSLYKHYKSKHAIFEAILRTMECRDRELAAASSVPEELIEKTPRAYEETSIADLIAFSKSQFRYWTQDEFALLFRKMLTIEQYRSEDMNRLYHQYLGSGPLGYVADLLGSRQEALMFYGPMYLLYSVCDEAADKEAVCKFLDIHLERWKK